MTTSRLDSGSTSSRTSSATPEASPPATSAGSVAAYLDFGPCQQKTHGISFPGATTTSRGRLRLCSILTFYYAGLRQCSLCGWHYGLALGEGSGLLSSRRDNFFSCCRVGFTPLPRQVCRFPAKYITGGQPSNTTCLYILLGEDLHLQTRPDNSHGRGAKYAGNVDKPGFDRRLFFGLSYCWFFSSSGHGRFRPAFDDRRLRLDYCSRPLCQL
jgi:hypothetical protein